MEGFGVGNCFRVGLIVVLSVLAACLSFYDAKAEPVSDTDFSWLGVSTKLVSETLSSSIADETLCTGSVQVIHLEGRDHTNNGCVFGDSDELRVASYANGQGYWVLAVSFPLEIDFHELRNLCGGTQRCAYAPKTDMFASPYEGSIGFFSNFSKHLVRHFDRLSLTTYYEYTDLSSPITIQRGDNTVRAAAVAFSDNGKWAIVELFSYGFMRVDLSTFSMRRVIAPSGDYGLGRDPTYELAISNTGRQVAVTGYMLGLLVYEVDSHCGDYLTIDSTTRFRWDSDPCRTASIDTASLLTGFQYGRRPSFDIRGQRLRLTAVLAGNVHRQVVISPIGLTPDHLLDYLALGDSFASGEGELDDAFYLAGTRQAPNACHVSMRSYPFLLANYWRVSTARSIACSGATTKDVVGSTPYFGQAQRAKELVKTEADRLAFETEALNGFHQGIVRQVEFAARYSPGFITIGVGGNDAGLLSKLKVCVNTDTCEWVEDDEKRFATATEIRASYFKLRESLRAIKLASPGSTVMVVSYPRIINEAANANCGVLLGTLLNTKERQFMDEAIKYLNSVIKAAAESEGVLYADIENAFLGHRLCDEQTDAMNGIRGGDDVSPVGTLPMLKLIGAESFHPTPKGHALSAQIIQSLYDTIPIGAQCYTCVHEQPAPLPSAYWSQGVVPEAGLHRQIQSSFLEPKLYTPGEKMDIVTSSGLFDPATPNNSVKVELRSEKVLLGVADVDSEGNIATSVSLPIEISEGYHTVHLYGYSRAGELVDVYQIIAIQTAESNKGITVMTGQTESFQGSSQTNDLSSFLGKASTEIQGQRAIPSSSSTQQLENVLGLSKISGGKLVNSQGKNPIWKVLLAGIVVGFIASAGLFGIWMLIWRYRKRHKSFQQV